MVAMVEPLTGVGSSSNVSGIELDAEGSGLGVHVVLGSTG
jgi:hypothetical protein